jgi:hypothetical protein
MPAVLDVAAAPEVPDVRRGRLPERRLAAAGPDGELQVRRADLMPGLAA